MLSALGPFRKAKLAQLGRIGAPDPTFAVFAGLDSGGQSRSIGLSYNYGGAASDDGDEESESSGAEKRQVLIDGSPAVPGVLQEHVRVVWLTPFMDRLFSEGSSERRRFLDNMLANFYLFYGTSLSSYGNLLKQRARILKGPKPDAAWLDAVEEQIVSHGISIAALRMEFEAKLNTILARSESAFPKIRISVSGLVEEALGAVKAVEAEDFFRARLRSNRPLFTRSFSPPVEGPHRSDFSALNLARGIGADQTSTGEQKLAVISMILAYAGMLNLYFGKYPLILVDEAPAHLDGEKRLALFEALERIPAQVWMTGVERRDFDFFRDKSTLFLEVENSRVSVVSGP
jgi:DNA replication and repair protein RecF